MKKILSLLISLIDNSGNGTSSSLQDLESGASPTILRSATLRNAIIH